MLRSLWSNVHCVPTGASYASGSTSTSCRMASACPLICEPPIDSPPSDAFPRPTSGSNGTISERNAAPLNVVVSLASPASGCPECRAAARLWDSCLPPSLLTCLFSTHLTPHTLTIVCTQRCYQLGIPSSPTNPHSPPTRSCSRTVESMLPDAKIGASLLVKSRHGMLCRCPSNTCNSG